MNSSIICLMSDLQGALSVKGFQEYLVEKASRKKSILFIPTEPESVYKTEKYTIEILNLLKANQIEISTFQCLDSNIRENDILTLLSSKPIIFLMGGDPIKQNHFLRKLNFEKYLHQYSEMIIGMSAGALNCCPNIHVCGMGEPIKGMNLYAGYIEVHYGNPKYENEKFNLNQNRYAICDNGALIIERGTIKTFGEVYKLKPNC